ncbi:MAG: hypothetical protein A2050_12035 [Candidatus Rokubacteria bacterium GWA2_73_35]|nr:MAG: hypothetical protein A2050_12035 [Candidatus Rokubacteria bacterium GWA2_73_35]
MAEVTGTATQDDVFQLRSEIATAQQAAQRAKIDVNRLAGEIDRRASEQARESERRAAALTERLDALAATLARLAARVDDVGARLDALARQLRAAAPRAPAPARPAPPTAAPAAPVPAPVARPAPAAPAPVPPVPAPRTPAPAAPATVDPTTGRPAAAPAPAGAPAGPTPRVPGAPPPAPIAVVPSPPLRPTTGALKPQDIYQAAYIDFSKGSYSLAIAGFREFLRRFPEHELAGSGQYWIGESYLSLARGYTNTDQADKAEEALAQAVLEFKKVLANHPRSDKVPTALYKEALALIDLKQPQQAQARLRYLIENFPQAEETPLARERLASLTSG